MFEPVYYGADPDVAVDAVLGFRTVSDALAQRDAAETKRTIDRLRSVMAAHTTSDGVWFGSRSWLFTARR